MNLHLRSLVAVVVMLSGCRSAHEVAVTSYQAATAPVEVVRHEPTESTTSAVTGRTGAPQKIATSGESVPPAPSATPRASTNASTGALQSSTTADRKPPPSTSAPATSSQLEFPTAKPVEGKPGYVYSPFDQGKYVDVSGYAPGSKVKDPYSGKIFLVP